MLSCTRLLAVCCREEEEEGQARLIDRAECFYLQFTISNSRESCLSRLDILPCSFLSSKYWRVWFCVFSASSLLTASFYCWNDWLGGCCAPPKVGALGLGIDPAVYYYAYCYT